MIQDGDTFNAAGLNSRLAELVGVINDVPIESIVRGGLRRDHLPGLLATDLFPNGLTKAVGTTTAYDTYEHTFTGDWSPLTIDLQAYSAEAPNAPYGPSTAIGTDGWRIVALQSLTVNAAEISTVAGGVNLDDSALAGVYLHGSVELGEALPSGAFGARFHDCIFLGFGFEDSLGSRHVIEDSIVPFTKQVAARGSISIGWFLTQDDLDEYGNGTVEKIHIVIAGHGVIDNTDAQAAFEVGSYSLSILPIHGGAL